MNIAKWIKALKYNTEHQILLGSCFLAFFMMTIMYTSQSKESETPPSVIKDTLHDLDTMIPIGYNLVPIEIANYETLDSLLGSHGVVDLYTAALNPSEPSQRIAYRVKIVRAPKNPSHFALLIPAERTKSILRHPGPYYASVRNPKGSGTVFEKEKAKHRTRIVFNDGD